MRRSNGMERRIPTPIIVGNWQVPGLRQSRFQLLRMVRTPAKAASEQDTVVL
jgi:hypothetical protein